MARLLFAAVAAFVLSWGTTPQAVAADKAEKTSKKTGPLIGHMVYFKLKDSSPEGRQKLIDACDKYLSEHEGTVLYSAGSVAEEFKREVNDRDWDVALHLVFANKAAHDKYQDHPDHLKFIEENKDTWAKVRVFDSALAGVKTGKKKPKTADK
ncbi:MAG: stress responsive protein [Gemmataceae bacterium]|nr:stress responsive protein [Gemmataceae bacterium]